MNYLIIGIRDHQLQAKLNNFKKITVIMNTLTKIKQAKSSALYIYIDGYIIESKFNAEIIFFYCYYFEQMQTYYSLQKLPPSIQYTDNLSPATSKVIRQAKVSLRQLLPVTIQDIKNMYDDSAEEQTIRQRWKQHQDRRKEKLNILIKLREKIKSNQYDLLNRQQRKGMRNKQNHTKYMNSKKSLKKFYSTNKNKKNYHKNKQTYQLDEEQYYHNYFIPKQQSKKLIEKQNSFSLSQKEFFRQSQKKKQNNVEKKYEEMAKKNFFQKEILCEENQRTKHSPRIDGKQKKFNYSKRKMELQQKYREILLQQTKQLEKMLQIEILEQQKRCQEMRKVSGKEAVRLNKIHMIERAEMKSKIQNTKKIYKQILDDLKNGTGVSL